MARVDQGMQNIKELRPDDFTLNKMDNELICMTLLRALPEEYSSFPSSLQMLDKFNKEKLQEVFMAEKQLRNRSGTAPTTERRTPACSLLQHLLPALSVMNATCNFCSLPGHSQSACHRYRAVQQQAAQDAKERAQEQRKFRPRGGKGNANTASGQEPAAAASAVQEFAGKASLHFNLIYTPSQCTADMLWTADTGATSHMTPHKHWLRDYKPLSILIHLANNHIMHSASVGTLLFAAELNDGQFGCQVLFSRVLHVLELGSNLLSVLYLV